MMPPWLRRRLSQILQARMVQPRYTLTNAFSNECPFLQCVLARAGAPFPILLLASEIFHASAAQTGFSSQCFLNRSTLTIGGPNFPPFVSFRTVLPAFNFALNSSAISGDMPGGALSHLK